MGASVSPRYLRTNVNTGWSPELELPVRKKCKSASLHGSRDFSSAVTAQANGGGFAKGMAAHAAQKRSQGNKSSLSLAQCCLIYGFAGRRSERRRDFS